MSLRMLTMIMGCGPGLMVYSVLYTLCRGYYLWSAVEGSQLWPFRQHIATLGKDLDPQHPYTKPGTAVCMYNPSTGEQRQEGPC